MADCTTFTTNINTIIQNLTPDVLNLLGETNAGDLVVITSLLTFLNTIRNLIDVCSEICAALNNCSGFILPGFSTFFAFLSAVANASQAININAIVMELQLILTDAVVAAFPAALDALILCYNNAIITCLNAAGDDGGILFCPPKNNQTPIEIKIKNNASNNDHDQLITQAGKNNNGEQRQNNIVMKDIKKRFDNLDQELNFLFEKIPEKKCKCEKCGKLFLKHHFKN